MKLIKSAETLKRTAALVTEDDYLTEFIPEFRKFTKEKKCRGLTATQVGLNKQIICLKYNGLVMINPTIIWQSEETQVSKEITLPCYAPTRRTMKRPKKIKVTYYKNNKNLSKVKTKRFKGRNAVTVCHLIDVLNGKPVIIT